MCLTVSQVSKVSFHSPLWCHSLLSLSWVRHFYCHFLYECHIFLILKVSQASDTLPCGSTTVSWSFLQSTSASWYPHLGCHSLPFTLPWGDKAFWHPPLSAKASGGTLPRGATAAGTLLITPPADRGCWPVKCLVKGGFRGSLSLYFLTHRMWRVERLPGYCDHRIHRPTTYTDIGYCINLCIVKTHYTKQIIWANKISAVV